MDATHGGSANAPVSEEVHKSQESQVQELAPAVPATASNGACAGKSRRTETHADGHDSAAESHDSDARAHAPKRFSSLDINHRFLQKATATATAPVAKPPAAAPPQRLSTAPPRATPSVAGAGAQIAQINQATAAAAAASSEGTGNAQETPRVSAWRSPRLVTAMPGRTQSPQHAAPVETKAPAAPGRTETPSSSGRTPWARVPHGTTVPAVSSHDFPTAAEAAAAQREADEKAAAAAAEDAAKQQNAMGELERFRGTDLPPHIHWDELDEEEGQDDVIDFGDGQQYKISDVEQAAKNEHARGPERAQAAPARPQAWGHTWSGHHFSDAPPAVTRPDPAPSAPVTSWGPLAQRHASLTGKPVPPPAPKPAPAPAPAAAQPGLPPLSAPQLNEVHHNEMHSAAERARKRREEDEKARAAERERARLKAQAIEEQLRAAEEERAKEKEARERERLEEERKRAEPSKVDVVDTWRSARPPAAKQKPAARKARPDAAPKMAPAEPPMIIAPPPVPTEPLFTAESVPEETPPVWRQYKVQVARTHHTALEPSGANGHCVASADMFTRSVDATLIPAVRRVHIPRGKLQPRSPRPIGTDEGTALDERALLASLLGDIDSDPRTAGLFDDESPRVHLPRPIRPVERLAPSFAADMFSAIPYQGLFPGLLGSDPYAPRREQAPVFAQSFSDRWLGRPGDTWGGQGPLAFSLVEPVGAADAEQSHLKTVWADAQTQVPRQPKNSLKSIADDMPAAIPLSVQDLEHAPRGGALDRKLDAFASPFKPGGEHGWPYRMADGAEPLDVDGTAPYPVPADYSDFMLSDAW